MSNKQKKRSNSFHSNSIKNQRRALHFNIIESKSNGDILNKTTSILLTKKEMISLKQLQNVELTTYDYIFVGRKLLNTTIQDFESFTKLLRSIKNKFKPSLFKANYNIQNIKKEGKFSITSDNLTNLIIINKKDKKAEISINTSYINISDTKNSFIFYTTKSIFKGKHCLELEIMNQSEPNISYGLINVSKIYNLSSKILQLFNEKLGELNIFKLNNPIFYSENEKYYNHFITYGDILGLCFDLDRKILQIYINGILRGTHTLRIEAGENCAFVPIISLGRNTKIIFNPGNNLKYLHKYINAGFIPLDEEGNNSYEKSQMKNVTDEFIDILIKNGRSIISNKNISNSDINQIYHIIFEFLANISFKHSYIIQKSFIKQFIDKYSKEKLDDMDLEFYYVCLKYILNSSKDPKSILKNLFLNLAENIHILMIKGKVENINSIKIIMKLFTFIFTKKKIMDIFSKMKITTKKIFKAIFVSFHIYSSLYNNYLDFEINNNIANINNNSNALNNINEYFPQIIISKSELKRKVLSLKNDLKNNSNDILNFFNELIISLFKNGADAENKKIFNIFKTFLKNELKNIYKTCFCKGKFQFNNIFKNIFVPAMNLFNQQYEKVYRTDRNSLSIKKYLKQYETDGEKIGGTIKHIFEQYPKNIPNFQELLSYDIKDYNNVFFLEFIYILFIDSNSYIIWDILCNFVEKNISYVDFGFLRNVEKESIELVHLTLLEYLYYHLFHFNSEDLTIFLQFLFNITSFNSNSISKFEILVDNLCKQYISILIKIIQDKNIKKLILKCESIECLQKYIYINEYFTDENLISLFDFVNLIHNDDECEKYAQNFMKIFENDMYNKKSKYYKFGVQLIRIIKTNKNFLRILIILLFSNVNTSLTKLEERFCEYKFKSESNQSNNSNNRHNAPNNAINNFDNLLNNLFFGVDILNNNLRVRSPFIFFRRANYEAMSDNEKLVLLEESFKDTSYQFIKLFNFYSIAKDIDELYDINSFENKNLSNLLLSLYNIIFSPKNIEKLIDDKTKRINKLYKKLLFQIGMFYGIILANSLEPKNDSFLKDLSKQRNIYHFKDIFRILEKYNPPKKENESLYNNLHIFIDTMEKIYPEEELLKLNNEAAKTNIELTKSGNKIEKHICTICADSVIDTHILPCEHSICKNCLLHYLSEKKVCPFCRVEIKGIKEDPNFKV